MKMDTKLQEILIRAKKDVFSGNLGNNLTTFKGDGLDFREIKEYEIGDDIRKINWKSTAKTNSTKINVFNIDRELNIVVVFLVSGSMHFGSVELKQETASKIIAHLAYSTIKNNNLLTSLFFSFKEEYFIPSSKNEAIVYQTTKKALEINCLKKQIDYKKLCEYINATIKNKALIFLVGDFYGDIDLSSIAYKHEVYSLIVRDRFEEYPYIKGEYDFVSPFDFSSSSLQMDKNIALKYQQLLSQEDEKLQEHFKKHQIISDKIYTNDDVYLRLSQILKG
jgi:uncharacterized protein (DUF58 family)